MPSAAKIALTLFCVVSTTANCAPRIEQAIGTMKGMWLGERVFRGWTETIQFIVGPDGAHLIVESDINGGTVALKPKTLEKDGSVTFTFAPQAVTTETGGNHPALTTGRLNVMLNIASNGIVSIHLHLPQSAASKFNAPTVVLGQPTAPTGEPQHFFLSDSPSLSFVYRDWRSREKVEPTHDELIRRLVQNGIGPCIAQANVNVTAGKPSVVQMSQPGVRTTYMIYSPTGDQDLLYGIASTPPMNAMTSGDRHNYPAIQIQPRGYFSSKVTIVLGLRRTSIHPVDKKVPVTILTIGGAGSYGPGCPIVDRQ